jgi:hypothetical protein
MRKTRFKDKIRIDPKQKRWIQENKTCRTDAGFLDIIINYYKRNGINQRPINSGIRKNKTTKDKSSTKSKSFSAVSLANH